VVDARAVGVDDREAAPAADAVQPGLGAVDLAQTGLGHRAGRRTRRPVDRYPFLAAAGSPDFDLAGARLRLGFSAAASPPSSSPEVLRTASRLAFRADMRSGTGAASSSTSWTTISSPAAFFSIIARTASR